MKVIGLLCFYDETSAMLAANVTALAKVCDHLVASDGGYFLFPGARPHSGIEQHDVITQAAYAAGIGVTIHAPDTVWMGNEVEKRNHLVQLGMTIATPDDWFLRIDADEVVTNVPEDFRARLEQTKEDVAGVTLWWRSHLQGTGAPLAAILEFDSEGSQSDMRFLIRAVPGLRVEGAHNFYVTDTQILYGRKDMHQEAEMADFNDLRIEHRHNHRIRTRNERAEEFNQRRDQLGIERVWATHVEHVDGHQVRVA